MPSLFVAKSKVCTVEVKVCIPPFKVCTLPSKHDSTSEKSAPGKSKSAPFLLRENKEILVMIDYSVYSDLFSGQMRRSRGEGCDASLQLFQRLSRSASSPPGRSVYYCLVGERGACTKVAPVPTFPS